MGQNKSKKELVLEINLFQRNRKGP
jgi:hypothetical protein